MSLFLGLHNSGQYPHAVEEELEFLAASIQTWANRFQGAVETPKLVPRAHLYTADSQSLNDATATALTWARPDSQIPTAVDDALNVGDLFVNTLNTRVTISTTGIYLLNAMATWGASATGVRALQFVRSGNGASGALMTDQVMNAGAGSSVIQTMSFLTYLQVGDFVEVHGTQFSGGALSVTNRRFQVYLLLGL